MNTQVYNFVKKLNLKDKILDVGSLDVNGSVKDLFNDYTGVDMRQGKNVDVQAKANSLPFKDDLFDNVLCLEMLEHDDCFWESIPEMVRVLKPGGMFAITTRGINFPKHGYPHDYWRFTLDSMRLLLKDLKNVYANDNTGEHGVFGHGCK